MHRNAHRRAVRYATRYRSLATSGLLATSVALSLGPSAVAAQADNVDWDVVAECESGADWSADTGNGFYGGLQFKEPTWKEFGGSGSPANASRTEQIAVANRILAEQGLEAWPKCGSARPRPPTMTGWLPYPLRGLVNAVLSSVPR